MRLAALAAAALGLGSLTPGGAASARAPLVMGPLYEEPARASDNPAPPSAGGCPVEIVELMDSRRSPQTLGAMLGFRAIEAPADRDAWLRSVFTVGLTARGFTPSFAPAGAAPPTGAVMVRVRLQALWASTVATNKVGDLVIRMSATGPGGQALAEKVYRGDQTAVNWAGTQSEFNGMIDHMFAEALDAMAADLRPLCPAAGVATATR